MRKFSTIVKIIVINIKLFRYTCTRELIIMIPYISKLQNLANFSQTLHNLNLHSHCVSAKFEIFLSKNEKIIWKCKSLFLHSY